MSCEASSEEYMLGGLPRPKSLYAMRNQAGFTDDNMLSTTSSPEAYHDIFRPLSQDHDISITSIPTAAMSMYEGSFMHNSEGRENVSAKAPLLVVNPLYTNETDEKSGKSATPPKVKDWPERPERLRKINAMWAFWMTVDVIMTLLPFMFLGDSVYPIPSIPSDD